MTIPQLSELIIDSKINTMLDYSGMDSLDQCPDVEWFINYPHKIQYKYNSRGFRDDEWPKDLKNAIWCLGDSYTVGIGSPVEHTWPYLLRDATGIRTINISMDGASNDCIARFSNQILTQVQPLAIIHQWSFLHRRETESGSNESRRQHFIKSTETEDVENLINAIQRTEQAATDTILIHSFIPGFADDANKNTGVADRVIRHSNIPNVVNFCSKLDQARDLLHYGPKTANKYVDHYVQMLKDLQVI